MASNQNFPGTLCPRLVHSIHFIRILTTPLYFFHYLLVAQLEVNGDDRFFWRLPLLPRSKKFLRYTCDPVNTPPHPPSAITNILVSELTYFISRQHLVLSLVFSWSGPMFPNGELKSFELMLRQCSGEWISNNEWEAEVSCTILYLKQAIFKVVIT